MKLAIVTLFLSAMVAGCDREPTSPAKAQTPSPNDSDPAALQQAQETLQTFKSLSNTQAFRDVVAKHRALISIEIKRCSAVILGTKDTDVAYAALECVRTLEKAYALFEHIPAVEDLYLAARTAPNKSARRLAAQVMTSEYERISILANEFSTHWGVLKLTTKPTAEEKPLRDALEASQKELLILKDIINKRHKELEPDVATNK